MRKTLLLFTGSYPFSAAGENTFLPQEIDTLRKHFETIILIPTATGGAREPIRAENVTVDTSYAEFTHSNARRAEYVLRSAWDSRFWKELLSKLPVMLRHPSAFVRLMHAQVVSRMTERWIRRLDGSVKWSESVLYTWWFDSATLGLGTFASRTQVPVVTRAHGRDLYDTRQKGGYIPFRPLSLARVSRVYSASAAGARYLGERYPAFQSRIGVSLLGIDDPGVVNSSSTDGVFRILSCSFLLPVKRIDLTIRGLAELGRMFPERRFEWTHIGDGPERKSLVALAQSLLPPNVEHEFLNYPGKEGLKDFYRARPADVFINTSSSEGTPVSVMEAISVGIPVIATSVGGNTEIVGPDNGVLIAAHPEPKEVAEAIASLANEPSRWPRLRSGSRDKWRKNYSAPENYTKFAKTILEL